MSYPSPPRLRDSTMRPQSRQSSETLALGLGFTLGSAFFVAWLGLRWPVMGCAVVPPLAAAGIWQRRRSRANSLFLAQSAQEANNLLAARGLQTRLTQLCEPGAVDPILRWRWEGLVRQMQSIRSLAARCVAIEPHSAVPLLVFMEGLMDQIEPASRIMQQIDLHASCSTPDSYGMVRERLDELHNHLSSCIRRLQQVHDSALQQSMGYPGEPIDFQDLLIKP